MLATIVEIILSARIYSDAYEKASGAFGELFGPSCRERLGMFIYIVGLVPI